VRRALPLLVSLCAVAAVIVPYVALGGASYAPTPTADPCEAREPIEPDGLSEALEQVALSGLDEAACELGVSREDLVLAIRSESALDDFAEEQGIDRDDVEQAVQEGLLQALDDARESGALSGLVAGLAERVIETVPPHLLIEALERLGALLP
jgi:uncharacterized protein YidB (DUF937 family)